ILVPRFETTRGLFWDGSRNFELRSGVEDDTCAGILSPKFSTTPLGGHLATEYDLARSRPHTWRIFSRIGFRAWSLPVPRPRPYQSATAVPINEGYSV
ncbi:hypothetical protein AVEN_245400-1, partial [Araneus ventricosus]